jgi:hypothetical protein
MIDSALACRAGAAKLIWSHGKEAEERVLEVDFAEPIEKLVLSG